MGTNMLVEWKCLGSCLEKHNKSLALGFLNIDDEGILRG